jgi:hypothetical protein
MKMKTLASFILAILFLLLYSCGSGDRQIPADLVNNPNTANGKQDTTLLPVLTFEQDIHDFGKIIQGETVSCTFNFTNTGKSDLLIGDVSTSCGCTVPSYPHDPIKPGGKGSIKITFNSAGKHGFQTKNIVVLANTQPNTTLLRIKAEVVAAGNE